MGAARSAPTIYFGSANSGAEIQGSAGLRAHQLGMMTISGATSAMMRSSEGADGKSTDYHTVGRPHRKANHLGVTIPGRHHQGRSFTNNGATPR